ncbi:unknown [Bacteroides sp. CAG:144]|nr:unknown [Bacteroides sp. CAG:144]
MRLGRTDRRHDTFSHTSQNGIFAGSAHQLANVGTHRYPGFGNKLNAVFGNRHNRRRIDHFGIDRHLHGLEHITTGQIDSRSHLETEIDIGLRRRHKSMNDTFYTTAGQIMRLQLVASNRFQSSLVSLDHSPHDNLRRHLTDTHQKELNQGYMHSRNQSRYPKQKRHKVKEHGQRHDTKCHNKKNK